MNPFAGTLNRLGYFLWSFVPWLFIIANGIVIDLTKKTHQGTYWLGYRAIVVIVFFLLFFYITIKRLQNAGLSPFIAIVALVPFIDIVLWIVLLLIPPKIRKA